MRLKDLVIVVTGGGSGIGRECALLFAREGARIAIVDRDAEGAEETAVVIREGGGHALVRVSDVGVVGNADADANSIVEQWGRIDTLLATAGFGCGGTVVTTDPDDWDAVFRANVSGTWLWSRAVIPVMQKQGSGTIITFASQLALAGGRENSAYIASKGAILSLTRTMALDFAGDGIRVNALIPGAIDTPMLARSFARHSNGANLRAASQERHALKRFGKPAEVAEAALFLASNASSFVTGTSLSVDGGWLAG